MSDSNYSSEEQGSQEAKWGRGAYKELEEKHYEGVIVWRWIKGYKGLYKVSTDGRVKSMDREMSCISRTGKPYTKVLRGRILRCVPNKGGYRQVELYRLNGSFERRKLARVVLEAFVCDRPDGMVSCHSDDDPTNNRLDNLRWGTSKENSQDMVVRRRNPVGEQRVEAKLTEDDVRKARKLYDSGRLTVNRLAEMFGVHRKTMWSVVRRETWKHVE